MSGQEDLLHTGNDENNEQREADWAALPDSILVQAIASVASCGQSTKPELSRAASCRRVCSPWSKTFASAIRSLSPDGLPPASYAASFSGLRELNLSRCCEYKLTEEDAKLLGAAGLRKLCTGRAVSDARLEVAAPHLERSLECLALGFGISDRGVKAVGQLRRLTSLDLSFCWTVTDSGVAALSSLSSLSHLNLGGCSSLTDAGLEALKPLSRMTSLSLWGCGRISDAGIQNLADLVLLSSLNLGFVTATKAGLQTLSQLTNLSSLDLTHCPKIHDDDVTALGPFCNLTELNVGHCHDLSDRGVQSLKHLASMRSIWMNNCRNITNSALSTLQNFTALETLVLRSCTGISTGALAKLKPLGGTLASLDVSWCNVGDPFLDSVSSLPRLSHLNLAGNRLSREGLANLRALSGSLTSLNLSENPDIGDWSMVDIGGLRLLQRLQLGGLELLTDAGLVALQGLLSLRFLSLSDCIHISSDGVAALCSSLPGLTEIDLIGSAAHLPSDPGRPAKRRRKGHSTGNHHAANNIL